MSSYLHHKNRKTVPEHKLNSAQEAVKKAKKKLKSFDTIFLNPNTSWEQCKAKIPAYNKATEALHMARVKLDLLKSTGNEYGRPIEASDRATYKSDD